ncbi:hypothetical protein B0H14DRAFT_3633324 [Mycena olivaceomarginata]|nr:hypothetical protein B0H14DRAFT_3633324 [Mycena olivaceomarginata]
MPQQTETQIDDNQSGLRFRGNEKWDIAQLILLVDVQRGSSRITAHQNFGEFVLQSACRISAFENLLKKGLASKTCALSTCATLGIGGRKNINPILLTNSTGYTVPVPLSATTGSPPACDNMTLLSGREPRVHGNCEIQWAAPARRRRAGTTQRSRTMGVPASLPVSGPALSTRDAGVVTAAALNVKARGSRTSDGGRIGRCERCIYSQILSTPSIYLGTGSGTEDGSRYFPVWAAFLS